MTIKNKGFVKTSEEKKNMLCATYGAVRGQMNNIFSITYITLNTSPFPSKV